MTLTFVHTADWQIGKAFARFPTDVAVQLRAARLDAIDRLADVARTAGAEHVLVAGDVFDSELLDGQVLRQALARMRTHAPVTWHLLPGNHDPSRPGGLWERLVQLGTPANVRLLLSPAVQPFGSTAVLLPAPLAARQTANDPTDWMDGAATSTGLVRIGIAHGSVRGFGSLGEAAVPIEAARRKSAGLDYLALGDWHGTKEVTEGVWYSGTPEPDSFMENDPGHALVVTIEGPRAVPRVEVVETGRNFWIERRIALSRLADLEPFEAELRALGPRAARSILRLTLEGAVTAAEAAALEQRLADVSALLLTALLDRRRLRILASHSDREMLADPTLREVADRLVTRSRSQDPDEAAVAARAMQMLLAYGTEAPPQEGAA